MLSVIVDTSAIQYVYQLDLFDLFLKLYSQIIIPAGVASEISQGLALGVSLPDLNTFTWVKIVDVSTEQLIPTLPNLGMGEREVISLSVNIPDSLAILDDGLARAYAKELNVAFTGTLGILLKAKQAGLLNMLSPVLIELNALGFRVDSKTQQFVLKLAGEVS
jgi:predicted nucleic acid-binding protein